MTSFGNDIDTSLMTPAQFELGARMVFSNDKLKSFTPFIMASYLDACCLGILLVLFVRWWTEAKPQENRWVRWLVFWLMLSALGGSTWLQGYTMILFSRGFGIYRGFLDANWLRWGGMIFVTTRIPASCFFLHRAYRLCNNSIWPLLVVGPILVAYFALGVAVTINIETLPYTARTRDLSISLFCLEVSQDLILTTTIAVQVYRSKTGWMKTDKLVVRLLLSLAETQTPPTIFAILFLITFVALPNTTAQLILLFHPKVIGICVLTVLISRISMRKEMEGSSKWSHSNSQGNSRSFRSARAQHSHDRHTSRLAELSASRGKNDEAANTSVARLVRENDTEESWNK